MEVDTLMLKNLCNCSLEKITSQGLTKDNPSKEKAMQIMQECAKELVEKKQK
ncbi:hypothetical protein [Apibacter muscae]|uniref:hypothetical protein n=1 Tax=Apibacter muscae TaxID=2509004 RepID=UPI001624BD17|nr:hypothetical protein [Apibacter muscae]